jgi:hypothetical protein
MSNYAYIFRWVDSLGYIPGSVPPRFDAAFVRPTLECGSLNKKWVDRRWSRQRMIDEDKKWIKETGGIGFSVGYVSMDEKSHQRIIPFTRVNNDA